MPIVTVTLALEADDSMENDQVEVVVRRHYSSGGALATLDDAVADATRRAKAVLSSDCATT